ncbi:Aquaporin-8 like [Actinidia chinensis var. chinensis]|uniref:Aquaporin-8 like n=1 Tax=Actinidia chinensis var. chinensis TaxID=1590841 RepID=A0A2R6R801_ACTCC|nr:Aquaporin-8 like [Actinidia chinensis var. chinensis]
MALVGRFMPNTFLLRAACKAYQYRNMVIYAASKKGDKVPKNKRPNIDPGSPPQTNSNRGATVSRENNKKTQVDEGKASKT